MKFLPFSDFKLILYGFSCIKIAQKGGFYSTDLAELTWRTRPARRCDAELTPRDKAASGPREAQVAETRGKKSSKFASICVN